VRDISQKADGPEQKDCRRQQQRHADGLYRAVPLLLMELVTAPGIGC
jgi:hypothetical protein